MSPTATPLTPNKCTIRWRGGCCGVCCGGGCDYYGGCCDCCDCFSGGVSGYFGDYCCDGVVALVAVVMVALMVAVVAVVAVIGGCCSVVLVITLWCWDKRLPAGGCCFRVVVKGIFFGDIGAFVVPVF